VFRVVSEGVHDLQPLVASYLDRGDLRDHVCACSHYHDVRRHQVRQQLLLDLLSRLLAHQVPVVFVVLGLDREWITRLARTAFMTVAAPCLRLSGLASLLTMAVQFLKNSVGFYLSSAKMVFSAC
jgi:hypothetical protein